MTKRHVSSALSVFTPANSDEPTTKGYVDTAIAGRVPTTRTVNTKALSADVTLNQDDVGDGTTYKQYSGTEKTKLAAITGTNTGDQTSIVGITGTTAQFNTALSDNDFATLAGTETLAGKTLTTPKIASILDTNGNPILDLTPVASAVNRVLINNSAAGNSPAFNAVGNDTNLNVIFIPKGNGSLRNYVGSGQTPTLDCDGPDTNLNFNIKSKGTGVVQANGVRVVDLSTAQVLTNKDLSSGTNTFPTLNQNTTGSAAKWTTARNLAGNSVDGSAAVNFANKFVVQGTTDAGLSAAQFLGALGTGVVKNTTTTGVLSIATPGTDYVVPGGALGTPSSGVLTNTTGYPNAAVVHTTRTGIYQFEQCNALTSFGSLHTRRPFMITQKPIRFRVHIRNYDLLGDAYSTGTLTGVTAYIGPMAVDANGNLTGNFSATPTQIQTSTTLASGAGEVLTGWISPGTFTINSYKWYGISVGWTATAQQVANGGGLHWSTSTPSDAGVASPAGLARADNQGFLNIYVEYEFANDLTPIILVVGNSLSGGGNTSALANRGEVDAWCGQWALRNGGICATLAAGGAWLSHFASTSTRWNNYSTLNTALDPDYVVFFATGSSDIAGAAGVSTVQTEMYDSMTKARAMWPNAQILLTTNPPRIGSSTAAVEADRKTFNTWLTTSPGIAASCIDIEQAVTDNGKQMAMQPIATGAVTLVGDTMPRLDPYVDSGDHEHWKPYAHARVAALMPGTRQIAV